MGKSSLVVHLFDLLQADSNVLCLVIFVIADPTNEVAQVLVEEAFEAALDLHQSHLVAEAPNSQVPEMSQS